MRRPQAVNTWLMSSANLDLVRSIYADWERGDFSSADWAHPEIELVVADGPTPERWQGLAGIAEGWGAYLANWEDYRAEAEEYRELDVERILVFTHNYGRGKTSALEVGPFAAKGAVLFQVRGGKVKRLVAYFNRRRALADLGLPQETGPSDS
jgi:ketosteroid isomerase-like protein